MKGTTHRHRPHPECLVFQLTEVIRRGDRTSTSCQLFSISVHRVNEISLDVCPFVVPPVPSSVPPLTSAVIRRFPSRTEAHTFVNGADDNSNAATVNRSLGKTIVL